MELSPQQKESLEKELTFDAAKSGGPGGQHVNKSNSKIILKWNFYKSTALNQANHKRIVLKLKDKNPAGELVLHCDSERSQLQNKNIAIKRFYQQIEALLHVPKKRKKTKPHKSAIEKRIKAKKINSEKKQNRGWLKGTSKN